MRRSTRFQNWGSWWLWRWRQRKLWLNQAALERAVAWIRAVYPWDLGFDEAERIVRENWNIPVLAMLPDQGHVLESYRHQAGLGPKWMVVIVSLVRELEGRRFSKVTFACDHRPVFKEDAQLFEVILDGKSVKVSRTPTMEFWVGPPSDRPTPTLCLDIDHAAKLTWEMLAAS